MSVKLLKCARSINFVSAGAHAYYREHVPNQCEEKKAAVFRLHDQGSEYLYHISL